MSVIRRLGASLRDVIQLLSRLRGATAQNGVWVLDDAASWARDKGDVDAANPLAKAILTGQPAPVLVLLIKVMRQMDPGTGIFNGCYPRE